MAEVDFVKGDAITVEPNRSNGAMVAASEIVPPTPTSILELAVRQNANVDTLAKLLELQERFEASQARKAFEEAFAAFKKDAPKLERTRGVSFDKGKTEQYKYTPLDEIAKAIGPKLAEHGLNYNWKQESTKESIAVTCVLRHKQGHSIENQLSAQSDPSGSKNAIQAIGSAVSYLRRYTLLGVLGMATGDEDTDGVTMHEAADFLTVISESRSIDELKKNYQDAIKDGLAKKSPKAIALYMQASEKRQKELAA